MIAIYFYIQNLGFGKISKTLNLVLNLLCVGFIGFSISTASLQLTLNSFYHRFQRYLFRSTGDVLLTGPYDPTAPDLTTRTIRPYDPGPKFIFLADKSYLHLWLIGERARHQ